MTKHEIDHSADEAGNTSERFAKIEADKMPRPQTQELQKRGRKTSESRRLKEFTGIERRGED